MPSNLQLEGFTTRPLRLEDAPAIVALMRVCQRAKGDEPSMTVDELKKEWHGLHHFPRTTNHKAVETLMAAWRAQSCPPSSVFLKGFPCTSP